MDLFSNKTVVGLFDNEEELGQALSKLHKQGFGEEEDELVLINQHYLAGENPFMQQEKQVIAAPVSSSSGGMGAVIDGDVPAESNIPQTALEERLMDLGVDEEEVGFYTQEVKRGNTLVVVQTDDEKATQVQNIMRQEAAKSSIS
jgi:hypothetical protein